MLNTWKLFFFLSLPVFWSCRRPARGVDLQTLASPADPALAPLVSIVPREPPGLRRRRLPPRPPPATAAARRSPPRRTSRALAYAPRRPRRPRRCPRPPRGPPSLPPFAVAFAAASPLCAPPSTASTPSTPSSLPPLRHPRRRRRRRRAWRRICCVPPPWQPRAHLSCTRRMTSHRRRLPREVSWTGDRTRTSASRSSREGPGRRVVASAPMDWKPSCLLLISSTTDVVFAYSVVVERMTMGESIHARSMR